MGEWPLIQHDWCPYKEKGRDRHGEESQMRSRVKPGADEGGAAPGQGKLGPPEAGGEGRILP